MSFLVDLIFGILSGSLSPTPEPTDERIERWRRRPFLLRWTPIVIGVVVIPLAFIALFVWLIVDSL